ncbi:unnamed protein product [Auanema sp. JU1783]|nr:unnamed protein product [Auanema sp. JU1783]
MTPPQLDVDTELAKLSKTCLSKEDHNQIWNNTLKYSMALDYIVFLINGALEMIGQTEMRATLNFAPRRSWASRISKEPSESELASVATIEGYYDLVEPHFEIFRYDTFFFEKTMSPAIAFLDNRFPFIRAYYRRSFEDIRLRDEGEINRNLVDNMIEKYLEILYKLNKAVFPTFHYDGEMSKNCAL